MLIPSAPAEARGVVPACPHFSPAVRSLLGLGADRCRWPLGDGGTEVSAFCAAPRAGRSSYCARHRALACEAVL